MSSQNELVELCRNSCFSLNGGNSDIHLRHNFFDNSLDLYLDWEDKRTTDIITYATPAFQRSNDKWSEKQQSLFVQNILKGYRSEIILYRFGEIEDCMIMDGLQRLTAIKRFFDNKIKVFGLLYNEFDEGMKILLKIRTLSFKNITFKNWEAVGRFYIGINEGITHSEEDIQKCKDWFLKEKGIQL